MAGGKQQVGTADRARRPNNFIARRLAAAAIPPTLRPLEKLHICMIEIEIVDVAKKHSEKSAVSGAVKVCDSRFCGNDKTISSRIYQAVALDLLDPIIGGYQVSI